MYVMRRAVLVSALIVALLVIGGPASAKNSRTAKLDPAVASKVQGLPVPSVATVDPQLTSGGVVSYRLPVGVTYAALKEWYDKMLPMGKSFRGWTWCGGVDRKSAVLRNWTRKGTTDFLALSVVDDSPDPPSVMVLRNRKSGC